MVEKVVVKEEPIKAEEPCVECDKKVEEPVKVEAPVPVEPVATPEAQPLVVEQVVEKAEVAEVIEESSEPVVETAPVDLEAMAAPDAEESSGIVKPEPKFARGDEVVVTGTPDPSDKFYYEHPEDVLGKKASVYDDEIAVIWDESKGDWLYLVQTESDMVMSAYEQNLSKAMAAPGGIDKGAATADALVMAAPEAPNLPTSILPEEGAQAYGADDEKCPSCGAAAGACACASMSAPEKMVHEVEESAGEAEEVIEKTVKDVVGGTVGTVKDVVEEVTHPKDWVAFAIGAGLMASPFILAALEAWKKKQGQQ